MTSKFTREELLNIIETDHVQCGEASALASMALAAMDSEPVAEVLSSRPGNDTSTIDRALPVGTQLYRHAQQLVVPPMQHWEELCRQYPDMSIRDAIIRAAWWNHCRAAMLQAGNCRENANSSTNNCREIAETSTGTAITPAAPDKKLTDDVLDEIIAGAKTSMEQYLALSLKAEREVWRKEGPTDDERIMAIEGIHNCERCGDEGWVVGEMGIMRCACGQAGTLINEDTIQAGNPPVIPEWIPVSERMPENDGAYLCWDNRYVTTYAFIFGAWQANQFIAKNITHWMPLPAAPQEVKGE